MTFFSGFFLQFPLYFQVESSAPCLQIMLRVCYFKQAELRKMAVKSGGFLMAKAYQPYSFGTSLGQMLRGCRKPGY